jgi:hypothetical protein
MEGKLLLLAVAILLAGLLGAWGVSVLGRVPRVWPRRNIASEPDHWGSLPLLGRVLV